MFYVISDTHFCHNRILEYCNRPFTDITVHNRVIIDNWNNTVTDEDTIFFLGDFLLGSRNVIKSFKKQLRGNIVYIKGNHDFNDSTVIIEELLIHYKGKRILMIHNPMHACTFQGLVLHGHSHELWKLKRYYLSDGNFTDFYNCSVEVQDYTLKSLDTVLMEYDTWKQSLYCKC